MGKFLFFCVVYYVILSAGAAGVEESVLFSKGNGSLGVARDDSGSVCGFWCFHRLPSARRQTAKVYFGKLTFQIGVDQIQDTLKGKLSLAYSNLKILDI